MSASLMEINFDQCLPAAVAGDGEALGRLLDRYRRYMELLARLQIDRSRPAGVEVSDVVQETFLHAGRGIGRFRGITEAEFLAWMRRVLASVLADHYRRAQVSPQRRLEHDIAGGLDHSSQALGLALLSPHSSPSQQACRRENAVLLADALAALPEHYRQVLILHHLEDLSFPEVAQRMGRSLDSVKKLWIRGLARIRSNLGDRS